MTAGAGTEQSTRKHRPGRIIERPRLIKLLDDADAPVILIVAPAGYGKTTLARQWARTLNGVVWVSCTPAHRDVATFAEDVAAGIDKLGGNASRFIGEYIRAKSNPQKAAREISHVLATKLAESAQWLIIDDHHELVASPEVNELVSALSSELCVRLVVSSRLRPQWISTRHILYGEAVEVTRSDLALTANEVRAILGARPDLEQLVRRANGWPAVVSLASGLTGEMREEPISSALHRYVADELFRTADTDLQQHLLDLALLPDLSLARITARFGADGARILEAAADLGFVSPEAPIELHPLLREFLLFKVAGIGDRDRVRAAVGSALNEGHWSFALELVLRFAIDDLVDPLLQRAYAPLIRSGRLATLEAFARRTRGTSGFPPAPVEVIDAEVALRDGHFGLAAAIAQRAHDRLPEQHALRCRASLVTGRAQFFMASFAESAESYRAAETEANDDAERVESSFGLASVQVFSEHGDPHPAVDELRLLRHTSPTHLLRFATADLNLRRFTGFAGQVPLDEAVDALGSAEDPHARSAFAYTSGYLLGIRGEYSRAEKLLALLARDVAEFDLDFVRPFLDWTTAFVCLGLRRFGNVDRHLQRVEDIGHGHRNGSHQFNARLLRARLMLQTAEAAGAVELLRVPPETAVFPSWLGELAATRALAEACLGFTDEAHVSANKAVSVTRFVEVSVLAQAARAVASAMTGNESEPIRTLFKDAERLFVWDPVVCALRASRELARQAADDPVVRPVLKQLLHRTGDNALARQAGLPTRNNDVPDAILSPRELEVLGLMARGMRNKEIGTALFVAESTVKVHVRHILEKLGVRSRSAAVARFERTARD